MERRDMSGKMMFDATRKTVVDTCRILADQGFLAGTAENVALRADDSHFAVTPSAADYYAMSPEDVCTVRLSDGRVTSLAGGCERTNSMRRTPMPINRFRRE